MGDICLTSTTCEKDLQLLVDHTLRLKANDYKILTCSGCSCAINDINTFNQHRMVCIVNCGLSWLDHDYLCCGDIWVRLVQYTMAWVPRNISRVGRDFCHLSSLYLPLPSCTSPKISSEKLFLDIQETLKKNSGWRGVRDLQWEGQNDIR